MKKLLAAVLLLTIAIGVTASLGRAADDEQATISTKVVMKRAMKEGLCKKVASGKADDAEKQELLKLFQAMANNDPPKGDAVSWKEKNAALVKAANGIIANDPDAKDALTKAANCKSCHMEHKPS